MRTPHRVLIQIDLQIEYAMQKKNYKAFQNMYCNRQKKGLKTVMAKTRQ